MKIDLKNVWKKILNFLLPPQKDEVDFAKITTEEFSRRVQPPLDLLVSDAYTLYSYKDPLVKKAIWLLKYKNNDHSLQILGSLMTLRLEELLENLLLFENFNEPLLVPVPMSKKRKKERGGNQTEKLGEHIVNNLPKGMIDYSPIAMKKTQNTRSQATTKGRNERLRNLEGSFEATSRIVSGKNIILLDDVITTGATVEECRKTLKKAGAKKVIAFAVAH